MNVSNTDHSASLPKAIGWALAALLSLLAPAAVLAQGAPIPLLPGPAAGPTASPAGGLRDGATEPSQPRAANVLVQELGTLDPNAIGVLDESHGGFDSEMWAGGNLATLQKVLPLLPAPTPWRSLARLERKLLLTAAALPPGRPGGEPLIKLRADKLWALGEVEGLAALLKLVPNPAMTPELRRLQVEVALVTGDNATACEPVALLRSLLPSDPFPTKLQVFCQFAAGKGTEAGLGLDLLREQKVADAAFYMAADAMSGLAPGKIDGLTPATPLNFAMARLAKLPLSEAALSGALPLPLLRVIAETPSATIEARLLAMERAEAAGAVDTEALRRLYQSVGFSEQELAAPLSFPSSDRSARGRAFLYRAAQIQALPAGKAQVMAKALTMATDQGLYAAAARLYAEQIAALPPAPELLGFALPAGRALLVAQQPSAAKPWLDLLRGQAATNDAAASADTLLWPLARLSGADAERPPATPLLAAWRKLRGEGTPEAVQRRTALLYSLLAAFGDKLPAEDWLPLFDGPLLATGPHPRPAAWQGLRIAAEERQSGGIALFGLLTLGEPGLGQIDPSELYRALAALHGRGLDADARAVAVEAALANGI